MFTNLSINRMESAKEDQRRIHMEKATEITKAVAGATILTVAIISLYFIGFIFL